MSTSITFLVSYNTTVYLANYQYLLVVISEACRIIKISITLSDSDIAEKGNNALNFLYCTK